MPVGNIFVSTDAVIESVSVGSSPKSILPVAEKFVKFESPCIVPFIVIASLELSPSVTAPFNVVAPATVRVPAVATLPVVSATVKAVLSTAIPPFRLANPPDVSVPVVAILPVLSATVKAPSTSIPPSRLARPDAFNVVILAVVIPAVDNVVAPVTPSVPVIDAFSSISRVSICAVPSMNRLFHSLVCEPKFPAPFVFGISDEFTPCPLPTATLSSSMFPTPSTYKSFHLLSAEPKSCASSEDGIKSESNRPVTVTVSDVALPKSILPVAERFTAVKSPVTPRVPAIVTLFREAVPDEKISFH